jgi:hypothetical protein
MGTTLDAIQGQPGVSVQYVLCIEGVEYLITDGNPSAAAEAWTDAGWEEAIGGLFIESDFQQQLDPWAPFQPGSDLTFLVRDTDGTDRFGLDVFKTGGGTETRLTFEINATDTTITTKAADEFPASGSIFIGTERIFYSSRDTTTDEFTVSDRGVYAPFRGDTAIDQTWGRYHRGGGAVEYGPDVQPVVSTVCRSWHGKWVGLWMHRKLGTTLDVRAQAQLVWAGKIVEIRDTINGDTRVTCENVMSTVANTTLLRDQWTAEVREGCLIPAGSVFQFRDIATDTVILLQADATPTGDDQFESGYRSADELISIFNTWLAAHALAEDVLPGWTFAIQQTDGGPRVVITPAGLLGGEFGGPAFAMRFLGFDISGVTNFQRFVEVEIGGLFSLGDSFTAPDEPYRIYPRTRFQSGVGVAHGCDLLNAGGTFVDQTTHLPESTNAFTNKVSSSNPRGLVMMDGSVYVAEYVDDTELGMLSFDPALQYLGRAPEGSIDEGRRYSNPEPLVISQFIWLQGSFAELVPAIFASTGTPGYNHADHDNLGLGLGLSIPYDLLGDGFVDSCSVLAEANTAKSITLVIEKPTKLVDLLGADMTLRRAHLIWKSGQLRFTSWSTPTAERAVHALTEANKAAPIDAQDDQRSPLDFTDKWVRNIVKIDYNRVVSEDTYRDHLVFEDRSSIDDLGEARPVTIKARNSYGKYAGAGESIEALAPLFLAYMPYFSRPAKIIARTIDISLFEDVAPGDIVTISDRFARDPVTGERGLTDKAGIIVSHRHDFGGPDPGNPTSVRPMDGEIQVAIFDLDRFFAWAPAAMLDDTADAGGFTSGYNSGTLTIRCKENEYSDPADSVTDTSYFAVDDEITVVEVDPSNPASPQSWDVAIDSKSGNDLTLSAALTGFDSAKFYRVVPRYYASAAATQLTKAYQADETDMRIQDLAAAHQWGEDAPETFPASTLTDLPERYAEISYGDGAPLDVGYETGVVRTLQNLAHFKTAPQSPSLEMVARKHTTVTASTWKLAMVMPIFQGPRGSRLGSVRNLNVAPRFRSTDGTSVSMRVTLADGPPLGSSLEDVTRPQNRRSVTFTTTSTTMAAATAQAIAWITVDSFGEAFLIAEVDNAKCEFEGFAQCEWGSVT